MSQKVNKAPASKPAAVPKPPKKLVPRTAPKVAPAPVVVADAAIAAPQVTAPAAAKAVPVKPAAAGTAAVAKTRPVRKPTEVEATVAKHQKVLAEALVKAQAIKYDQPKVMKQPAAKPEKPSRSKKVKLVRDSYAMPEGEYVRIAELKTRLLDLGAPVKKSELLRGGIAVLAALNDAELKAVMSRVERIKTGRPNKK